MGIIAEVKEKLVGGADLPELEQINQPLEEFKKITAPKNLAGQPEDIVQFCDLLRNSTVTSSTPLQIRFHGANHPLLSDEQMLRKASERVGSVNITKTEAPIERETVEQASFKLQLAKRILG